MAVSTVRRSSVHGSYSWATTWSHVGTAKPGKSDVRAETRRRCSASEEQTTSITRHGTPREAASSLVQVAGLFRSGFLVEVEAVVALPD